MTCNVLIKAVLRIRSHFYRIRLRDPVLENSDPDPGDPKLPDPTYVDINFNFENKKHFYISLSHDFKFYWHPKLKIIYYLFSKTII